MKQFCPNKASKEFKELASIFGEDKAYFLWMRNKGNELDKAPNGAESKLFQTLLNQFNGDRREALIAKSRIYSNYFFNWFGDWVNNPESSSKVVDENGEPLIVYHYTNETFDTFDINYFGQTDLGDHGRGFYLTPMSPEQDKGYFKGYYGNNVMAVFLNIKNPLYVTPNDNSKYFNRELRPYKSHKEQLLYKIDVETFQKNDIENKLYGNDEENKKYKNPEYIGTQIETERLEQVKNKINKLKEELDNLSEDYDENAKYNTIIKELNKYDGVINKDFEIVVPNSNQIKSATDNSGAFSKDDDNIYHNLTPTKAADEMRKHLIERKLIHSFRGDRVTKETINSEELICESCVGTSVLPIFYHGDNSTQVELLDNITIAEDLRDEISRSDDKAMYSIISIARTLQQKIPQLQFQFIKPNEIPQGVNKNANSFIKGNKVYLVVGRATTESTIEEFMHPIIYSIQNLNASLFNSLFEEAKKDFPKLWTEIQDTYTERQGFNYINRQNELVTQALSRYVHSGYKKAQDRNTVKGLVTKALNYIAKLINNAIEKIGGKYVITPEYLPKMKLGELAKLIVADDSQFRVWTTEEVQHSINSHQQKAQQVSEEITKRFYVLYKAYEKMPNKSQKRQRIQNEIFEKFNELKQTQDYHAVSIALDFALQNLGTWDYVNNEPTKQDSISGYLWKQMNLSEPWSGITPDILVDMYKNSIGFYDDLVSNYIPDNLDDMMSTEDKQKATQLKSLIDSIIKPMWLRAMATVGDKIVDQMVQEEVDASEEDKENMKKVAKDWLHKNIMYGDISSVTSYIYNNSFSSNPIIKQAFHLIQHAETKTLEEIQPVARRITKAYQRANKLFKSFGPNWQTVLMEFDTEGIPTGNFVRPVNYGQYEKDIVEFTKKLNSEFEETYGWYYEDDGTGMIINSLTGELADNEEWGPNGEEPVYIKYLKRIEDFKCERSNRRYTINYYNERMSRPYRGSIDPNEVNINKFGHGLSPKTLARYNYIQSNINYYLDLCTNPETGFSYPERLSIEDKHKLDDWYYELDKLSNPYNEDATPKQDDERQMAFEIRAWQKWLGEKLYSQIDLDSFYAEYEKIKEEADRTGNQTLITDFFKYNSSFGINPDFIEQTIGQFPKTVDYDQESIHAKLIKKSLQNLVKTKNGYSRDLEKMENSPSFWLDCKHTDQIIEENRIKQSQEFAETIRKDFVFEEILYRDANGFAIDSNGNQVRPEDEAIHNDLLTYHEYMINKYTSLAVSSPSRTIPGLNDSNGNPIVFNGTADEVKKVMTKLFSYQKEVVDETGSTEIVWVPLSIFTIMLPRSDTFFNSRTNRVEKTMLYVPKGRFAEKSDESGAYMNSNYDHKDLNAEQPKVSYIDENGNNRYDNSKAYNDMTKDSAVFDLYNLLIEEMQNAQKNYRTKNRRFNYRLPQINANTMQLWSRIIKNGFSNTLESLYESATSVEENDESMRTSDDYITNPDGTVATDVPLKFIRKLKHPENITTDIAGSTILFANMAINYKNKVEIDAILKTLRYNLDYKNRQDLYRSTNRENPDDLSPFDNENSIQMFDSMVNKHVYGNQWSNNPNQPVSMSGGTPKNAWRGVVNSTLIGGTSGAAIGSLWGMLLGSPGVGAIMGGAAGAGVGLLNGAIQNGFLEGVAFFKTMKNIQRIETTQTLALNLFSMLVGFGDSSSRILKESMMGKYMTVRDVLTSLFSVFRYTPQCLANIGNPLANNKLTRAMQLNGISKGIHQTYERMNYGRIRKIGQNLLMGGFSLLDWMTNALLMRSFYNNYRFYDGDKVEKGFYTKYELEQAFLKKGFNKHQADLAHMMAFQTLWGAYDNNMEVKPEYQQYVTQKIKTRLRSKTLKRGALYNGMNPDNDIPRWKQDLVGSIVGSLRSWLAQSTQHLVAGGTDNIVREVETEKVEEVTGTKTKTKIKRKFTPLTDEQRSKAMAWDYETGTPQDQIWVGIFRSFKTLSKKIQRLALLDYKGSKSVKFSEVEKYAWKDSLIYLGVLAAMMFGWTFIHDWAADVPKPEDRYHAAPEGLSPEQIYDYLSNVYIPNEYWKLQIDNIAFRAIESQITSIDPTSAADVVNSVTALKNGLGEHLGIIKPLADISGASGHSIDEINKQGGYKFYTRGDRALYKFIGPLDNLHTAFTYYGITENMKFYTNTYGGIYRAFGYDFKKDDKNKSKKNNNDNGFVDYGFGNDSGFGGDGGFEGSSDF